MKAILCFAWLAEAKPFLDLDKTKNVFSKKNIQYFTGNNADYLIMGLGQTNAATAIGWLNGFNNQPKLLCNIGLAGSANNNLLAWHLIAKVNKENSTKSYFPEVLAKTDLTLAELLTVYKPANKEFLMQHKSLLVDMEGYAFCKAAKTFVSNSNIMLLKFVSDAGSEEFFTQNWQKPYKNSVEVILNCINNHLTTLEKTNQIHQISVTEFLHRICIKLNPTVAQQLQIKNALKFAIGYQKTNLIEELITNLSEPNKTKEENTTAINQLLNKLQHV